MKKTFAIALTALTTLCAVAAEPFNYLIGLADKAIQQQDWSAAENAYSQVVRDYPDSEQLPLVLSNMAMMQINQGKDSLAIVTYGRALELEPDNAVILENRAISRMNVGDTPGALADYARVVELDPTNTSALFFHGSISLNSGDTIAAKSSFDKLLRLRPDDAATHKAMAAYYTKVRDYPAAIVEYNVLIGKNPEVETLLGRAACNMMLERYDDASGDIAEALRLNPNDGEAHYMRAALAKARYELDEARAAGRRAVELGVDPRRVQLLVGFGPESLK